MEFFILTQLLNKHLIYLGWSCMQHNRLVVALLAATNCQVFLVSDFNDRWTQSSAERKKYNQDEVA